MAEPSSRSRHRCRGWALPGTALLAPLQPQESRAVGCPHSYSQSREQLTRTETLCFGRAAWESVSPLNFMTGSNSFGRRTDVVLFLNTGYVIVSNNRKLTARYAGGQKAVPLGRAAERPHRGRVLRAACHCRLRSRGRPKAPDTPRRTSGRYKGRGTAQSRAFPHAPHSCGATEAFVRVCLSTLDCKGRSKMKRATSPALGTGEETPPSLTGCPWLPLTRHWEKSRFWQTQDISF